MKRASTEGLIPEPHDEWAKKIWEDRKAVAKDGDAWCLRHAARILGYDQREVDRLLREAG